jgi:hypothetical protein
MAPSGVLSYGYAGYARGKSRGGPAGERVQEFARA